MDRCEEKKSRNGKYESCFLSMQKRSKSTFHLLIHSYYDAKQLAFVKFSILLKDFSSEFYPLYKKDLLQI